MKSNSEFGDDVLSLGAMQQIVQAARSPQKKPPTWCCWLAWILVVGILWSDLITNAVINVALLYVAAVVTCSMSRSRLQLVLITVVSFALVWIGMWLGPHPGSDLWPTVIFNRTMTSVSILVVGTLLWYRVQDDVANSKRTTLIRSVAQIFDLSNTIIRGLDGRIHFWSDGAKSLYGYTSEDAVGTISHELLHTVFPEPMDHINASLATGSWTGELQHLRKDGTKIWVASQWAKSPSYEPYGVCVIEVNNDITDSKHVQSQLAQVQKLDSIGQLAAGIAHDFNNLLTVILGRTDLLLNDISLSDGVIQSLEEILQAGQKAAEMTRQLLTFSRQQLEAEPKEIPLNDIVGGMEGLLRRLIEENIDLQILLGEPGVILADQNPVEQVILNLVVNARDAMPTGGTLLVKTDCVYIDDQYVRSHFGVQPGTYAVLEVTDTGVGIPEEIRVRIFEPFFTTKPPGKGTGLGLSTAYGIITRLGGVIAVYSEPGQGTVFKVLLPSKETHDAITAEMDMTAMPDLQGRSGLVLLAEDEPGVRKYVTDVLTSRGFRVIAGSNGREALRMAEPYIGQIHLVLTDMVMPEMSGSEFAVEIRARQPGVPVIRMSGYTDRIMKSELNKMPYIQKPFTSRELMRAIEEAVAHPNGS